MDKLEKKMKIMRAYEINQGDFSRTWKKIKNMFDKCDTYSEINKTYKKRSECLTAYRCVRLRKANGLELA